MPVKRKTTHVGPVVAEPDERKHIRTRYVLGRLLKPRGLIAVPVLANHSKRGNAGLFAYLWSPTGGCAARLPLRGHWLERASGGRMLAFCSEEIAVTDEYSVKIHLDRVLRNPETPPKPVHKFFYTVLGGEIALETGYYDIRDLRAKINDAQESNEEEAQGTVFVTDRFSLSPAAALDLLNTAESLVAHLKETGILPGTGTQDEEEKPNDDPGT